MNRSGDSPVSPHGHLTRRAALSFLARVLWMSTRALVALVTIPILIRGVGLELYGIWSMIQKLSVYISLGDVRAAGATKLLLSVRQHSDDHAEARRIVGASIAVWAGLLPVMAMMGTAIVILAPRIIPLEGGLLPVVRLTLVIFIAGIIVGRLLSLPNNILYAMNLGYRAMFAEVVTPVLTGAMMLLAIWTGLDLPGFAMAALLGVICDGLLRHLVASRTVAWYGADRPRRQEIGLFLRLCGWMQLTNLGSLLLGGADVLIVGHVLGPAAAAVYFQTGFVHRLMSEWLTSFFQSAKPGIIGLCGAGEWQRVADVRREMVVLWLATMTVFGAGTIVLNRTFIGVWLGPELFAGQATNVLLFGAYALMVLVRNEMIIVDGMLAIKEKAVILCAAGVVTAALGLALTASFGMAGMAAALVCGHLAALLAVVGFLRRRQVAWPAGAIRRLFNSAVVALAILIAAAWGAGWSGPSGWGRLVLVGAALAGTVGLITWLAILGPAERRLLRARLRAATERLP